MARPVRSAVLLVDDDMGGRDRYGSMGLVEYAQLSLLAAALATVRGSSNLHRLMHLEGVPHHGKNP